MEFGYFSAMPYGVSMAGALGARVIKVENMDGDPMRWSFGPPEWDSLKTIEGKESICLDARTDRGRRDGDANAAVGVLSAILFGLRHKVRTGGGQLLAISMLGGNVFANSDDFNRYPGKPPGRQADAEQLGLSATYRLYQAQTGWVFLAAASQPDRTTAVSAAGRGDLLSDERFASNEARDAHDAELGAVLEELFRSRPASELETLMLDAGAPCVAVTEATLPETAVSDPRIRAMGLVVEIDHPAFGSLLRYAPPAALSATPGRVAPACTLAQHTAAILGELGYSENEIAKLAAVTVVRLAE